MLTFSLAMLLPYQPHLPLLRLAELLLVATAIWAALRARSVMDPNARARAIGAAAALAAQPLAMVALDQGLPFISYGGSEIVAYFACVGLLLAAELDGRRVSDA
jgi:cell division protein FtsW (lipid II flippase)